MNDTSQLYFECHVTIAPPQSMTEQNKLDVLAKIYDFKSANFAMVKEGGELQGFASARDKSYSMLFHRMISFVMALKGAGFKIIRYKIEDTIIDSNAQGDFIGAMDDL